MKTDITVGVVLGGGGSLGFAHIGVLKALIESNVVPTKVVGTSMGAIVGAFYCAGTQLDTMEKVAKRIKTHHFFDISFSRKGFLRGRGVNRLLSRHMSDNITFEDLKYEFKCNALDLLTREEVVLSKGRVIDAIRASSSVPGVFAPVQYGDKLLVDAGIINNVADNIMQQMAVDLIISVDVVNDYPDKPQIKSLTDVVYYSLLLAQLKIREHQNNLSDIIIKPNISNLKQYLFRKYNTEKIIKAGYDSTIAILPKIKKLIAEKNK